MKVKPRILIVDDRLENLVALEKTLADMDVDFIRAMSGNEALAATLEDEFALALVDVQMPGMDGYEAIHYIREQERFSDLPILALTAKAMVDDREKCIAAGANDYMPKPVDVDRLLSLIRVWLYK